MHSKKAIEKDEEVLFVPRRLFVTPLVAMSSEIGQKMMASGLNSKLIAPQNTFLAFFILHEQLNSQSEYYNYFNTFPSDFRTFPLFFSDWELIQLTGSELHERVRYKREELARDY